MTVFTMQKLNNEPPALTLIWF